LIDKSEILKLFKLSRLEFQDHEIPKVVSDIQNIMKFTDRVANHEFSNVFDNSYDVSHRSFRNNNIRANYEKCSHEQIMSGANNKNGFFFVKHFSK